MDPINYSEMFGKPGEDFHKERIFGFALYDILGTLIIAYIISKYNKETPFYMVLFYLFVFAQILHVLFGVETEFIKKVKNLGKSFIAEACNVNPDIQ